MGNQPELNMGHGEREGLGEVQLIHVKKIMQDIINILSALETVRKVGQVQILTKSHSILFF